MRIGVAEADQLYASGRSLFAEITRHVAEVTAQGVEPEMIVGDLVGQMGQHLLACLGGDDEDFWKNLWQMLAALSFAAVSAPTTTASKE